MDGTKSTFARAAGIVLIIAAATLAIDIGYCIATGHDYPSEPYRPYRYFAGVPLTIGFAAGLLLTRAEKARRWLTIGFIVSAVLLLYHTAILLWYLCHRVVPV
ncbi:MAG: hypothetical protein ABI779_11280 [Acidobacteriota bacterium]